MRVRAQAPCLTAFLDEAARPSAEVGPVRPQLRFSDLKFSESSICFLSQVWGVGVRGFRKFPGMLLKGCGIIFSTKL